ncbi:transient receptor potential cation channel subfamily A member 1-like isoform X2 [Tubulanus polymorphus]|uniref:transient receptor potential cation channel subfamily A member 1-like isoform X2 n=1 Tax=Tubulanus polymorphus TaxID=672921 RepID=UPI003DA51DAD
MLKILLESKGGGQGITNANVTDDDGSTPLHEVALHGSPETCKILLDKGANPLATDINDVTPLMLASAEGHPEVMRLLIDAVTDSDDYIPEYKRSYIGKKDNEGNTSLYYAVQNGNLECARLLLNEGADVNVRKCDRLQLNEGTDVKVRKGCDLESTTLNETTANLMRPLHIAAVNGFSELVQLLLDWKAEIDPRDCEKMTPLHKAAMYDRVVIIKILIDQGADINAKDINSLGPLHVACWKGQTEAVEFLLDNGAQINSLDTSLKTCLHWAVEGEHSMTVMSMLVKNGKSILDRKDRNDQNVLHYAAYVGNNSLVRILLEAGADASVKDTDEKTPLHIAAESNNLACAESLIEASKSELNDDDIDGRTPLLLASINGHRHVVKVLLSFGADTTSKDDSRCTALILAAHYGNTPTMIILLDHHANVNDGDKLKNTSLHHACSSNHADAVRLLLERHADVTLKNSHGHSPLDVAINSLANEAAIALLKHKSWRQSMCIRDKNEYTPMQRLIERLPEAAKVVMDHCVRASTDDHEDKNLEVTFDYTFLDPGPDDPMCKKQRWFAMDTMVKAKSTDLLSHPLSQNLLSVKWVKCVRYLFYSNLLFYVMFVLLLNIYTAHVVDFPINATLFDEFHHCPIYLNESEKLNSTLVDYYMKHGQMTREMRQDQDYSFFAVVDVLLLVMVVTFFVREIVSLIRQKMSYFFDVYNYLVLALLISTCGYIYPPMTKPCLMQWRCGWIAMFLSWFNFIMYMRRVDWLGIYLIMFTAVFKSAIKMLVIVFFFICAFGSAFYIVMGKLPVFETFEANAVTVMIMTVGEINYKDSFVGSELSPFKHDCFILLVVFVIVMPIMIMNLLVGIAVGDIDKIQKSAYFKRLAMQFQMISDIETTFPRSLQRKVHFKTHTIRPNSDMSCFSRFRAQFFGTTKSTRFIQEDDEVDSDRLKSIVQEMASQKNRLRGLQRLLEKQGLIIQQLGRKFELETRDVQQDRAEKDSYILSEMGFDPRPSPSDSRKPLMRALVDV